jgi:hypothetical protein
MRTTQSAFEGALKIAMRCESQWAAFSVLNTQFLNSWNELATGITTSHLSYSLL